MHTKQELDLIARAIRLEILEVCTKAGTPHIASQLSCVDILVAAYWRVLQFDLRNIADLNRDRFIFSKGHAAPALYITLCKRGFFPHEVIETYALPGSHLGEQPSPGCAPGVELATGSLGHGLPVGLGHALSARIQGRSYRTFVVMSDGECNEGSVWEASMLAPAQKVKDLTLIVDFNKWQATGRSREVMSLDPLAEKFRSFGWDACEVDGHDIDALSAAMNAKSEKPRAIVAHTVKGRGVSFMEDDNNWHYLVPKPEHLEQARKELAP